MNEGETDEGCQGNVRQERTGEVKEVEEGEGKVLATYVQGYHKSFEESSPPALIIEIEALLQTLPFGATRFHLISLSVIVSKAVVHTSQPNPIYHSQSRIHIPISR